MERSGIGVGQAPVLNPFLEFAGTDNVYIRLLGTSERHQVAREQTIDIPSDAGTHIVIGSRIGIRCVVAVGQTSIGGAEVAAIKQEIRSSVADRTRASRL